MRFDLLSLVMLLVGTSLAAGCTSPRCKTDSDCFAPEVCIERRCEPPAITIAPGEQDVAPAALDMDVHAVDSSSPAIPDMHVERDVAQTDMTADAGVEDQGREDKPRDMGSGSCQVDPFTFICQDDEFEPNNVSIASERLSTSTSGCRWFDFEPFDRTIEATMCPIDGADWYSIDFGDCDDSSFIIEVQVELLSDCDPNIIGLNSATFDCADDLVNCTIEDGKPTLRAIIEPPDSAGFIRSAYFEVHHKMQQDVTFDYRLSVKVRQ